jgi:TolB-like protein/DNA-binding winged helix-turn-helix (wHTH) protein/tetratricopeptide (TPR) repeat protein
MGNDQGNGRIRFGRYEADLTAGELFRRGKRIPIQKKPFQILELLLRAAGEVVSRDRLVKALWSDVHVEQQRCLNTAMRKLRTALDDTAAAPRVIETVGSRGYRLLLPVAFPNGEGPNGTPAGEVTLAVLPFENLSNGDDDFFSLGFTEQLIAQLGRVHRNISVIAPVSAMRYLGTSKTPAQVGRELNSDYLLCGSVFRGGQHFRITAKLIRAADQVCVWADSYARDESDLFLVQDEITRHIARAILRTLPAPAEGNGRRTAEPAIYEKYLKAGFFATKSTEPAFAKAVELFQQVIAEDPEFGPAYASLAVMLTAAGQYGVLPPKTIYDRVHALASQALVLSPALPETYVALGFANLLYHAKFSVAETAFLRALELNHSFAFGHLGHSMLLTALGQHEKAVSAMQRARELDPLSPMVNAMLAAALYFGGQLHEALEQACRTIEMEPNFPTAHGCAGWALSLMGDHEAAIRTQQMAVRCCPESRLMLAQLAHVLATAGKHDEARDILHDIINFRRTSWISPYWIALVHAALGEIQAGLDWLDVAADEGDGWRVLAAVDPRLKALAANPRFTRLLARVGLAARTENAPAIQGA